MRTKPYQAKTLSGAQARVRQLEKIVRDFDRMLGEANDREKQLTAITIKLAKLAAKGPAFFNPLEAWEAETIRDRVLAQIGMAPDGKPLPSPK